jgi:hypothetical protein
LAVSVFVGAAALGALADHVPLGAVDPTDQEQLGIYALNRARNDPAAYGTEVGFDFSALSAKPPLAMNRNLVGSSRFHAAEMFGHHYFAHTSAVTGVGPNAMAVQAGYDLFGNGLGYNWSTANTIESNARGVNQLPTLVSALKALIIDDGVPGLGHRVHLMALASQFDDHREVGMGVATGTDSFPEFGLPKLLPTRCYSIHTANRGSTAPFLTGVVFRDANGNLKYDAGEGIGGVAIGAGGAGTTTLPSGGWSLAATAGSQVVTCSGPGFSGTSRAPVTVGSLNIEVDFHSGLVGGEVSFGFRDGLPAALDASASQRILTGVAPLDVLVTQDGAEADYVAWELAAVGGLVEAATLDTTANDPGLFPIFMDAHSTATWASDVVVAVADSPDGAGEGTTLPSSRAITLPKGMLKRNFKLAGKDQARISGNLELPGGFAPSGATVQVCIGGALRTFTLDAKGKGKDLATGSTVAVKAKYPAEGAGVPATTQAKVTAVLKGDLARALEAAGVRNRTEVGTADLCPVALYLDGVGYSALATNAVTSTFGKAGKGILATPLE